MKTIITLLTATVLVAGAASAMACDRQMAGDATSCATSVQASHGFGDAFASAIILGEVHDGTVAVPSEDDFQLPGR